MSFVDTIMFHARAMPEKPAIVLGDRVLTYGMLAQGIVSVENRILTTSLKRGDVAAVVMDNPTRHFIVVFALYRLGITSVSISRMDNMAGSGLKIAAVLGDRPDAGEGLPTMVVDDGWFPSRPGGTDAPARRGFAGTDQIARIRFSTGTTGGRKAIGFTAADLEWDIATRMTMFAHVGWQRMLCLSHFLYNGFSYALMTLTSGNTLLFAGDAADALRMIDLYGAELLIASPQHLREMLGLQREMPTTLPTLKLISVGGATMELPLRDAIQAMLCKSLLSVYSATECGPIAIGLVERLRQYGNATGFVTPWATVEVVGDDDTVLPPGEEGILRIRTDRHAKVLNAPAANGAADPWFRPGDRGKLLPNGVLIVTGRTTEMIETAGGKIPPEQIEDLLMRRPDVKDAAAIGVERNGVQELWVVIVPRGDVDPKAIAAYLATQQPPLMTHQIRLADALPRGETGKILRRTLRDMLSGE
ncbi:MAG TPA: class I adenylate-forming enzyme family protein [Stellaceae bacterium]|jgi:acyl-coenzyme A synthetase/AMP-(fatty) acid ligase